MCERENSSFQDKLVEDWTHAAAAVIWVTTQRSLYEFEEKTQGEGSEQYQLGYDLIGQSLQLIKTFGNELVRQKFENLTVLITKLAPKYGSYDFFLPLFRNTLLMYNTPLIQSILNHNEVVIHKNNWNQEFPMSPLDQLLAEIFDFLCSIFVKRDDFDAEFSIYQQDIVEIIFSFLNSNQPIQIRKKMTEMISVFSKNQRIMHSIINYFWLQYMSITKAIEFRNITSWIIGLSSLQLSLETPDDIDATIQFLINFNNAARKADRGVLQIALLEMITGIANSLNSKYDLLQHSDVTTQFQDLWNIVNKWNDKPTHAAFIFNFQIDFITKHVPLLFVTYYESVFPKISQYCCEKEDEEVINALCRLISAFPNSLNEKFADAMNKYVVPIGIIVKGNKFLLRYQNTHLVYLTHKAIALKNPEVFLNIASKLYIKNPSDVQKKIRLICTQVIATMCRDIPSRICDYMDTVVPWMEVILLRESPGLPEEMGFAIQTFPLLHSYNITTHSTISQTLYDIALSEKSESQLAFNSLCTFIRDYVTLDVMLLPPTIYISQTLLNVGSEPNDVVISKLKYANGFASAYSSALLKCIDQYSQFIDGDLVINAKDWQIFRAELDRKIIPLILSSDPAVAAEAKRFMLIFAGESLAKIDELLLDLNIEDAEQKAKKLERLQQEQNENPSLDEGEKVYTLPLWLKEIPIGADPLTYAKLIISSEKLTDNLTEGIIEYYIHQFRGRIPRPTLSRCFTFVSQILSKPHKDFFQEMFHEMQVDHKSSDVASCCQYLEPKIWLPFISEINQTIVATGTSEVDSVDMMTNVYFSLSKRDVFAENMKTNALFADTVELYLNAFWRSIALHDFDFVTYEQFFTVFSQFCEITGRIRNVTNQSLDYIQICQTIYESKDNVTSGFVDKLLKTIKLLLEIIDQPFFRILSWITVFSTVHHGFDDHIVDIIKVLFMKNHESLSESFGLSFGLPESITSCFIRALTDVYRDHPNDFHHLFPNGCSVILLYILVSLTQYKHETFELIKLFFERDHLMFDSPIPSFTLLNSEDILFHQQVIQCLEFISSSLSPEMSYQVFHVLSVEIPIRANQLMISVLRNMFCKGTKEVDIKTVQDDLVHLSKHTIIRTIWREFLNRQPNPDEVLELAYTMKFDLFPYLYTFWPEKTVTYLMEQIVKPYRITSSFEEFVNQNNVVKYADFTSNSMNEIFLKNQASREEIIKQTQDSIPILVCIWMVNAPTHLQSIQEHVQVSTLVSYLNTLIPNFSNHLIQYLLYYSFTNNSCFEMIAKLAPFVTPEVVNIIFLYISQAMKYGKQTLIPLFAKLINKLNITDENSQNIVLCNSVLLFANDSNLTNILEIIANSKYQTNEFDYEFIISLLLPQIYSVPSLEDPKVLLIIKSLKLFGERPKLVALILEGMRFFMVNKKSSLCEAQFQTPKELFECIKEGYLPNETNQMVIIKFLVIYLTRFIDSAPNKRHVVFELLINAIQVHPIKIEQELAEKLINLLTQLSYGEDPKLKNEANNTIFSLIKANNYVGSFNFLNLQFMRDNLIEVGDQRVKIFNPRLYPSFQYYEYHKDGAEMDKIIESVEKFVPKESGTFFTLNSLTHYQQNTA